MNCGRILVFIAAICFGGTLSYAQLPAATEQPGGDVASQGPSYGDTVKWIKDNISLAGTPPSMAQVLGGSATIRNNGTVYAIAFSGCSSLTLTDTSTGSFAGTDDNNDSNVTNIRYQIPLASILSVANVDSNSSLVAPDEQNETTYRLTAGIAIAVKNGATRVSADTTHTSGQPPTSSPLAPLTTATVYPPTNVTKDAIPNPIIVVQYTKPGSEDAPQHMVTALQHLVDICKNHPEQAPKSLF